MAIRKPIFVVPLDLGTVVTGNAVGGHSVRHLGRFKDIGLTWKTDGASNVWARGQFDAAQRIDFAAMPSANALPDTQIRLRLGTSQAEVDGGSAPYDSGAVDFISPAITRDDGLYHSHLELPSVETGVTWWRIDITGHTGDFEAAFLVLGEKAEPSRFYNHDFQDGIDDLGSLAFTAWAVPDEEDGVVLRTKEFTLGWQTKAEMEATFRPMMERLGTRGMVYLCFDPEANTYRQANTYFGTMRKPPIARGHRKPLTFSQDFQILSLI